MIRLIAALSVSVVIAAPALADPSPMSDPSGHPVPEITVNMGPDTKQLSVQIGCEGQSDSVQIAPAGSGAFQKNIQIGRSNKNVQIADGTGNKQINKQISPPKGGWNCP